MSGTLNKVMLIGHLGDNVKVTYFDGGNCLGRFPIATNETYTSKQTGEKVTNTEWHNVVVRNKAAEICEKYLKKGDRVYVEGRIKTRKWQGEDGRDRYSTEIHVDDFTFLTQRQTDAASAPTQPAQQQPAQQQPAQQQPSQASQPTSDDDLPF